MFNPLQALQPNFVIGILGSGLGGPVGSILGNLLGGANILDGLKGMLDGLSGLFGKSQGNSGNVSPRPLPFSCNGIDLKTALNPLGTLAQTAQLSQVLGQASQQLMNLFTALGGCKPAGNPANNYGSTGSVLGGSGGSSPSTGAVIIAGSSSGPSNGGAETTSSASATSRGGGISSEAAMVDKAGASIDKMMGEAEKLMASDKPSDQLKGQMLMQRAMRMFEMISKMLEQRSQAQAKAIQAIK
jgi:hypothetical protein